MFRSAVHNVASYASHTRWLVFLATLATVLCTGMQRADASTAADVAVTSADLISSSPTGTPGDFDSGNLLMTPDGRYVAFLSLADNLVSGVALPTNSYGQAMAQDYLYDRQSHVMRVASSLDVSGDPTPDFVGSGMAISDDGRYFLFTDERQLPGVLGSTSYLYLRDMATSAVTPIGSANSSILGRNAMTGDGSMILYSTYDSGSGSTAYHLYHTQDGETDTLPSDVDFLAVSHDGAFLVYTSGSDLGLYSVSTGQRTLVATGALPYGAQLSPNDEELAYYVQESSGYDLHVKNVETAQDSLVFSDAQSTGNESFSANDHYLSFFTLAFIDRHVFGQTWLADLTTGENSLIDSGSGKDTLSQLSADGTQLAFTSFTRLSSNQQLQVYVGRLGQPDTTAPVVTPSIGTQPNTNGWYNADVTITWNVADPDSSATQPSPSIADTEGTSTYTSDASCDPAGNCATGSVTLNIDKTAPTISYTVSGTPNSQGWYNGPVTVTFTCADSISGIDSCTPPVTLSSSGADQTVTGTAVDKAGNTSSVTVSASIDVDSPTVAYSTTPAPNAAGWNNTDVTVNFNCHDATSGIATCPGSVLFNGDGADQETTQVAVDNAGNTTQVTTAPVNIDKTAPVLNTPAWTANPVALGSTTNLTVAATDNLSGVARGEFFVGTDPGIGKATPMAYGADGLTATLGSTLAVGVYDIGVRAKDVAGNWSPVTETMLVVYDPNATLAMTGKNKKDLVPSLARGDILPGLVSNTQTDAADYGFTVQYKGGALDPHNAFQVLYNTGSNCQKPSAQNCHSFSLDATSFAWLITDQSNNSRGRFQGIATVTVDGNTTTNPFTVTGIDGDRLTPSTDDSLILDVFAPGADPATAPPLYQASGSMPKSASVKIQ